MTLPSGGETNRARGGNHGWPRDVVPWSIVILLMVAYVSLLGTLALHRHQNLRSNALDLGYTDQAVWNTLHGRPFRFSTYLDAAFYLDIPIQEFREPGVLLGYHVEPILAAISLLYLIHDGPETLLWLQTIGIALGAIPVYLLARWRLGRTKPSRFSQTSEVWSMASGGLPLVFVLIYLLSPALQAANLSDFHAVALSPAFLLAAFYCLETDRPRGFVAFAFLATMCKEEVGLVVAMMGLWAAVVRRRRVLGLATFAGALGWSLFCVAVITPHFNGLSSSAFVVRYRQFGDSPTDIVRNLVQQPGLVIDWLRRPDVLRYPRDLCLSSGGLAAFCPPCLAMALPTLGINTFSIYGWMRSGGGHYSATIVPFLITAAIYGLDWLACGAWAVARRGIAALRLQAQTARPANDILNARAGFAVPASRGQSSTFGYRAISLALALVALVVALTFHHGNGVSPLSRRWPPGLDPVSEHARRAEPFFDLINSLPPEVPISASSSLYPHVGHRQRAYLFPTISDARYILIDVTGPGSPAEVGEQRRVVRDLLDHAQFGVAASDHGFLLLERDLDQYRLSPTFYDAFKIEEPAAPQVPIGADFSGLVALEGVDWNVRPVVRPEQVVEIVTYWRALAPLEEEYRLVFYFWDEAGALVRVQPDEYSLHWYPTWLWEPGQVVRISLPGLPVGDLPHAGVAVLRPGADSLDPAGRVGAQPASSSAAPLRLREENTIVELPRP